MLKIYPSWAMRHSCFRCELSVLVLLATALHPCYSQTPQTTLTVVSAADYRSYVAPQSRATVFGTNLADVTASGPVDATGQLSTQVGGTTVQVCGEASGIIFVSPSQISFVVPGDLKPGVCPVVVTTNDRAANGTADIRPVAPALFTMDGSGSGEAVAINAVTSKSGP